MEIPEHPSGITADWLTDTLRTAGVLRQARVTSLALEAVGTEKGITGHLARVRLDYDVAEVDAPPTLIAKCSAADPQARAIIHSLGIYEREVRFYDQLAVRS